MSKISRVTVLCPNGRRQTVNLTPNASILQILEEVCQKQNVNPDDFDICHYNKPMDLTLPVRFANLSNNAQLELQPVKTARKDCLVTVGLQLESGERIMNDFVPSTSIWNVVEQCLINKPDAANVHQKGEPVCVYMRQTLVGDTLKETTLRGLGLTKGSAVIRFMYRNPEDISDQAHIATPLSKPPKDISPEFSTDKLPSSTIKMECDPPVSKPEICNLPATTKVDVTTSNKQELSKDSFAGEKNKKNINSKTEEKIEVTFQESVLEKENKIVNNETKVLNEPSSQMPTDPKMELDMTDIDQDPPEEMGAIHYIGGRHAVLYSLDDITDLKKADLPDEFFKLTIEDARYLLEEFKKTRSEIENQPLLTRELRNRQMLRKLGRFKQTVIRVYFPERLVLQAVFEAQETVQDVCNFIRNYLEDNSLNFYLYTAPPKEKKDASKTLIESMLIPAAVVYFGSDKQSQSYLLNSLRDKISDPRAASLAAHESRKQAISDIEEDLSSEFNETPNALVEDTIEDYKMPGPSFVQPSSSVQTSEKVPKWLKLSKK